MRAIAFNFILMSALINPFLAKAQQDVKIKQLRKAEKALIENPEMAVQTMRANQLRQLEKETSAELAKFDNSHLSLKSMLYLLCGADCLKPSTTSLVGKYLSETKAKTVIRQFWRAESKYNQFPPHELGPKRLVIAVSAQTFSIFKKYFTSKNFLYLLNRHGNLAAFEGMQSSAVWHAEVLNTPFVFGGTGRLHEPIILDSEEGNRAKEYFKLAAMNQDLARFPWNLRSKDGNASYCGYGVWYSGCGTWFGNIPLGNKLVDEYYFSNGDTDGSGANHQKLKEYDFRGYAPYPDLIKQVQKVWTVPGHQQLGELIDPGANRRGEFDNAGWTTTTLLASAKTDRVPIIFYFVNDVTQEIPVDFYYEHEGEG